MNTPWLPLTEFLEWLRPLVCKKVLEKYERITNKLLNRFLTGGDWLLAKNEDRLVEFPNKEANAQTELLYIIWWAWKSSPKVNLPSDYLRRRACSHYWKLYYRQVGFLSERELNVLSELPVSQRKKDNIRGTLQRYCLYLGKPINKWTEKELEDAYAKVRGCHVTLYTFQNFMTHCGYSPQKAIKKTRHRAEILILKRFEVISPTIASAFKKYVGQIKFAREKSYKHKLWGLGELAIALQETGVDLERWETKHWLELVSRCREGKSSKSLIRNINNIRDFIVWGKKKQPSDFPDWVTSFPNEALNNLSSESRTESNDNRFRLKKEHADALIIDICNLDDNKLSELDWLCKQYWLVVFATGRRIKDLLNLQADCLAVKHTDAGPLPVVFNYTEDKAQVINAAFPIFEPRIGIPAILALQKRTVNDGILPLKNLKSGKVYVHLFGLKQNPWFLRDNHVNTFLLKRKEALGLIDVDTDELISGGTHGFRYLVADAIWNETGNIGAVQQGLGHKYPGTSWIYLISGGDLPTPATALAEGFDRNEFAGDFIEQVYYLLETAPSTDELLQIRADLMDASLSLIEFVGRHGKLLEKGYCMAPRPCKHYKQCWSCLFYLIPNDERFIKGAIHELFLEEWNMIATLKRFTMERENKETAVAFVNQHRSIIQQIKNKLCKGLHIPEDVVLQRVADEWEKWRGVSV